MPRHVQGDISTLTRIEILPDSRSFRLEQGPHLLYPLQRDWRLTIFLQWSDKEDEAANNATQEIWVHVNSHGRTRLALRSHIHATRHGGAQPGNDVQWRPFWRYWPKVDACHYYCGRGCFFSGYCAFYCVRFPIYHLSWAFQELILLFCRSIWLQMWGPLQTQHTSLLTWWL